MESQDIVKTYDISKHRPQVLIIGNGLLRTSGNDSWEQFMVKIAADGIDIKHFKDVPNTIKATAICACDDKTRREKYQEALRNYKYSDNGFVKKLLSLPFDAILTTNYTYELEYQLKNNYPTLTNKSKLDYAKSIKVEYNSLCHTYNRLTNGSSTHDIWHIHGEERRPSSIVLTHDEYARQIRKIVDYTTGRKNEYQNLYNDLRFKSWIDYFIMGDLYIIGQGFDFTEFDLWWLLSRRMREKAQVGKALFFEPQTPENKEKHIALTAFNVEVKDFDVTINTNDENERNQGYREFYEKAIDDIYKTIEK